MEHLTCWTQCAKLKYNVEGACVLFSSPADRQVASDIISEMVDANALPGRDSCYMVDGITSEHRLKCLRSFNAAGIVELHGEYANLTKWIITQEGTNKLQISTSLSAPRPALSPRDIPIENASPFELMCILEEAGWSCCVLPRRGKPCLPPYSKGGNKTWYLTDKEDARPLRKYLHALAIADDTLPEGSFLQHLQNQTYYQHFIEGKDFKARQHPALRWGTSHGVEDLDALAIEDKAKQRPRRKRVQRPKAKAKRKAKLKKTNVRRRIHGKRKVAPVNVVVEPLVLADVLVDPGPLADVVVEPVGEPLPVGVSDVVADVLVQPSHVVEGMPPADVDAAPGVPIDDVAAEPLPPAADAIADNVKGKRRQAKAKAQPQAKKKAKAKAATPKLRTWSKSDKSFLWPDESTGPFVFTYRAATAKGKAGFQATCMSGLHTCPGSKLRCRKACFMCDDTAEDELDVVQALKLWCLAAGDPTLTTRKAHKDLQPRELLLSEPYDDNLDIRAHAMLPGLTQRVEAKDWDAGFMP